MSYLNRIEEKLRDIIKKEPICSTTSNELYDKFKTIALSFKPFIIPASIFLPTPSEVNDIIMGMDNLLKDPKFIKMCNSQPNTPEQGRKREDYLTYMLIGAFLYGIDQNKMKNTRKNYNTKSRVFFDSNPELSSIGGRRKTKRRKNLRKRTQRRH